MICIVYIFLLLTTFARAYRDLSSFKPEELDIVFGKIFCVQGFLDPLVKDDGSKSAAHPPSKSPLPPEVQYQGFSFVESEIQKDHSVNITNKSPMSQLFELATYNKIDYQYRLISETGPPHDKTFSVSLGLGRREDGEWVEEYSGRGPRIRSAQRVAALNALRHTVFVKPIQKPPKLKQKYSEKGKDLHDNITVQKSSISQLYEMVQKLQLVIDFDTKIKGLSNEKTFVTICQVAEYITKGEGRSKKVSKTRAAEKMIDKLKTFPVDEQSKQMSKKSNIIKNTFESNPILRLMEWSSAAKGGVPRYEEGNLGTEGFSVHCYLEGHETVGWGHNKKTAKRNAAQKMLDALDVPHLSPDEIKEREMKQDGEDDIDFSEMEELDTIPNQEYSKWEKPETSHDSKVSRPDEKPISKQSTNIKSTEDRSRDSTQDSETGFNDELQQLGQVQNFTVRYRDFSKGYQNKFLSLASVSTDPPLICYGIGIDMKESRKQAALNTLFRLGDLGLDGKDISYLLIQNQMKNLVVQSIDDVIITHTL